jgi:hypothetical protein
MFFFQKVSKNLHCFSFNSILSKKNYGGAQILASPIAQICLATALIVIKCAKVAYFDVTFVIVIYSTVTLLYM